MLGHQDMHGKSFDHQLEREIAIHGVMLWTSMGLLMPLGILVMRLSQIPQHNRSKLTSLFYIHVIFQVASVSVATAGAIHSIRSFENRFNNHHQRIGLLLYALIYIQALIGLLRPTRGTRRRRTWYLVHWLLGTSISVLGMINIYTGIMAYHRNSSNKGADRAWLWNALFTAQLCLIVFFYLLIEKWDYLQQINHNNTTTPTPTTTSIDLEDSSNHHKHPQQQMQLMVLEPACAKANALKNLFD